MDDLIASANRTAFGMLHRLSGPRLSILIFHRVHATTDPLFPHEPDAIRFARLMRFVARSFRVLSLGDAAARLSSGTLEPRSLVITFDDGYRDNAEVALPILQRHGLVATFFVSTGFLDGGRMWNDSVIETIRACPLAELDLSSFGLGRQPLDGPAGRGALIGSLLARIKYLGLDERSAAIARLQSLARVSALPGDLMMRSAQVRTLHEAGMEIGAHTANHPILARLSPEQAEVEITTGRRRLEAIIAAPVDVFAYPNGKPLQDYDASHVATLRRLGFRAAVSTAPGVARAGANPFELPRFTPWGQSMLTWALRMLAQQRRTAYPTACMA